MWILHMHYYWNSRSPESWIFSSTRNFFLKSFSKIQNVFGSFGVDRSEQRTECSQCGQRYSDLTRSKSSKVQLQFSQDAHGEKIRIQRVREGQTRRGYVFCSVWLVISMVWRQLSFNFLYTHHVHCLKTIVAQFIDIDNFRIVRTQLSLSICRYWHFLYHSSLNLAILQPIIL